MQVPGAQYFESHVTYEDGDSGKEPHWRAIRDDRGRIVVAICHNMDLGDAWEWSDDPRYNEKWAGLAYRIGMNYFAYDLTHQRLIRRGTYGAATVGAPGVIVTIGLTMIAVEPGRSPGGKEENTGNASAFSDRPMIGIVVKP